MFVKHRETQLEICSEPIGSAGDVCGVLLRLLSLQLGERGHLLCLLRAVARLEAQPVVDDALDDRVGGEHRAALYTAEDASPRRLCIGVVRFDALKPKGRRSALHIGHAVRHIIHLSAHTVLHMYSMHHKEKKGLLDKYSY